MERSDLVDHLLEEILAQPAAIRATVEDLLGPQRAQLERLSQMAEACDVVAFTGMGSSFYALPMATIPLNHAGIPSMALEASELLHYQLGLLHKRALLVVVSQSGESVEIVKLVAALEEWPEASRPLLASISSSGDNTLARASDVALVLRAGTERSVAIKTHTCTQAALVLLAAALSGDDLDEAAASVGAASEAMAALLQDWQTTLDPLFRRFEGATKPFLLGRGLSQVSTQAGALMLKESGHVAAEGMSVGAFRHGTMELAGPMLDVLIWTSDPRTASLNAGLASELAGYGARVALVGTAAAATSGVLHVPLPATELAPLVEVPVAQLWSRELALAQGRMPGRLDHLPKVIRVE